MYVTVPRIFPWKMFLCSEEHTFGSLFEDIRKDLPDETVRVTKCSLSKSIDCTQSVEIELGFNVLQCCSLNGQFIRYIVEKEEERDAPSQQNTFTVLMSSAKEPRLPLPDEMRRKFQTIHPVCTECYAAGIKERTEVLVLLERNEQLQKHHCSYSYHSTESFILILQYTVSFIVCP